MAFVQSYGRGCRGSGGAVPTIGAVGLPRIGNAAFAVDVTDAAPNALTVANVGFGPSNLNLFGCPLLIQAPLIGLGSATSDATGAATVAFPIPNDPGFVGVALFGQFVVLDPGATLLGVAALSDGLTMLLGN